MTEGESREIVQLIRAAVADSRVNDQTLGYFEAALQVLDFKIGLETAQTGIAVWRKFPSWAEYKEIYRTQMKLSEPVGEQRLDPPPLGGREEPSSKRGVAAPEWVHVWHFCRMKRSPRNFLPFPQQDAPDSMSMEQYEELKGEWIAAGSPKADKPLPMTRSM